MKVVLRLSLVVLSAAGILSARLAAQGVPEPKKADDLPAAQLVLSYNAVRFAHNTDSDTFWLKGGGSIEFSGRAYRNFSAVVNVYGGRASNSGAGMNSLNLLTYTFGPRYTFVSKSGRYSLFGEGLVGEARGTHVNYPASLNSDSARSFALLAGSGLDVKLTKRFAVRPIEVDYLRTQLPVQYGSPQDNVRVGAGLVLRLGTK